MSKVIEGGCPAFCGLKNQHHQYLGAGTADGSRHRKRSSVALSAFGPGKAKRRGPDGRNGGNSRVARY
jgi:hypothetical protein